MANYRVPHKGLEAVYCRKVPTPIECQMISYHDNNYYRQSSMHQDDNVALVHDMGTSIPISIPSLLSGYQKDKEGGNYDNDKTTLSYHHNQLLPIITKLTGPSNVERIGYYLKSFPNTLTNNDNVIDPECSEKQDTFTSSISNATTSSTTIFYSPALDRHIPLFGHWAIHRE